MHAPNCTLCCSYDAEEDYPKVSIFQSTIIALLVLPTIVGNALVITLICKYRPLHTMTSVLLMNLSIADCGVGLFVTPLAFINNMTTLTITGLCKVSGVFNVTFCLTSTSTLTAIAIERYCAITQPLRYHKIVTRRGLTISLIFIWTFSFFWSIIPLSFQDNYIFFPDNYVCILDFSTLRIFSIFITSFCFIVPLFIILFCYISIYIVAKKQLKRINDIQSAVNRRCFNEELSIQDTEISTGIVESNESNKPRRSSRFKPPRTSNHSIKSNKTVKELKAAFTLFVVMAIYVICWLPYNLGILCHAARECQWSCSYYRLSTILVFVSSMCNPIVYFVRFKQYRKYLKLMFKCQKTDNPTITFSMH